MYFLNYRLLLCEEILRRLVLADSMPCPGMNTLSTRRLYSELGRFRCEAEIDCFGSWQSRLRVDVFSGWLLMRLWSYSSRVGSPWAENPVTAGCWSLGPTRSCKLSWLRSLP